jgi:hypothetical protein
VGRLRQTDKVASIFVQPPQIVRLPTALGLAGDILTTTDFLQALANPAPDGDSGRHRSMPSSPPE